LNLDNDPVAVVVTHECPWPNLVKERVRDSVFVVVFAKHQFAIKGHGELIPASGAGSLIRLGCHSEARSAHATRLSGT
jgi:hypothetical protein